MRSFQGISYFYTNTNIWGDLQICISAPLKVTFRLWFMLHKYLPEAFVRKCSVKKVFLEISQNSQENTCVRISFLIKKETLAQVPLQSISGAASDLHLK